MEAKWRFGRVELEPVGAHRLVLRDIKCRKRDIRIAFQWDGIDVFRVSTANDEHGRGRFARATRKARNDGGAVSGTGIDLVRGAGVPEAQLLLVHAEREDGAKALLIADRTLATGDDERVRV